MSKLSGLLCAGYLGFNLTREFAGVFAGVWERNMRFYVVRISEMGVPRRKRFG